MFGGGGGSACICVCVCVYPFGWWWGHLGVGAAIQCVFESNLQSDDDDVCVRARRKTLKNVKEPNIIASHTQRTGKKKG